MATLAAGLQARGFSLRTFSSVAEFIAALPLGVADKIIEGRLFAHRQLDSGEIFVIEYRHHAYTSTYDQPIRRLVHVRSPAFAGSALVSPTFRRAMLANRGVLAHLIFFLFVLAVAIPALLLYVPVKLLGSKHARGRVKFGGAFDRQFKVMAADEQAARALLSEPLRAALIASPLVESLSFDDGLTFNPVVPQEILVAADELVSLVQAASRT